jgi:hypothetical protein
MHAVPFDWDATLALGDGGTIIGGAWKNEGPDEISFIGPTPYTDGGMLVNNPMLSWPLIDALATLSVQDGPEVPVLDLRDGGSN